MAKGERPFCAREGPLSVARSAYFLSRKRYKLRLAHLHRHEKA